MQKRTVAYVGMAIGLSVLGFGCGSSPGGSPSQIAAPSITDGIVCGSGTWKIAGRCVSGPTFEAACASLSWQGIPAYTVTLSGGQRVCKTELSFFSGLYAVGFPTAGSLPILTEADPFGSYAMSTNVFVRANDKFSYSGSGYWGGLSTKTFDWWIFSGTSTRLDCDMYGSLGGPSGSSQMNGTILMGLAATDGTEVFSIGSRITNKVISHDGVLKIGFNLPLSDGYNGYCGGFSIKSLQITRCEDAAGNAYLCP